MKTIIPPRHASNLIEASDLSHDYYYGVKISHNGTRAFITTDNRGGYVLRLLLGLTRGNGYGDGKGIYNLDDMVQELLEDGHSVYQFDTVVPLLDWLQGKGENDKRVCGC